MSNKSLQEKLLTCANLTQKHIENLLPQDFIDSHLVEAMRYSALSEGKRIRPFLVMTVAEIFKIENYAALNAATALEFIHTYSLIHDDLPAMDDDDFRRGKPTNHKKFDEATAILAGDALLTYAFEILSDSKTHEDPTVRCELIKIIAKASGFRGMVGGQILDLTKANQKISKEELEKLHHLKTGKLFIAAAESGAILGKSTIEERKSLCDFAYDFGLAFQIKDDILDHHESSSKFLQTANKTRQKQPQENASIVDILGMQNAISQLELLHDRSITHLKIFGNKADLLKDLVDLIIERKN
jgi:farnesyl diphosphate synthase